MGWSGSGWFFVPDMGFRALLFNLNEIKFDPGEGVSWCWFSDR